MENCLLILPDINGSLAKRPLLGGDRLIWENQILLIVSAKENALEQDFWG